MARIATLVLVYTLAFVPICDAATVRQLFEAVRDAERSIPAGQRDPNVALRLQEAFDALEAADVLDEEIETFFRLTQARDAQTLAHRRQDRYQAKVGQAIEIIKGVANTILVEANAVTPAAAATVRELQILEQKAAMEVNFALLRKLERKYGPNSAKLNALEVLLAYALQRTPMFGMGKNGPGPFEAVTAYAPSYISHSDDKMRVIAVAEIGLRQYIFKSSWGKTKGRFAFLKPGYTSYGLAWTSGSDDPMRPPWDGDSRVGAFFGWGEMKVAWTGGDNQRFLVTQQFQLIPWVF